MANPKLAILLPSAGGETVSAAATERIKIPDKQITRGIKYFGGMKFIEDDIMKRPESRRQSHILHKRVLCKV